LSQLAINLVARQRVENIADRLKNGHKGHKGHTPVYNKMNVLLILFYMLLHLTQVDFKGV
jgi:hypothetical protein